MIDVYYDHKTFTFLGLREAALMVASNESISNVYAVEMEIIRCILCGKVLNNKYKFKLKEAN